MIVPSDSVIRVQGTLHFVPPSNKTPRECKMALISGSSSEVYDSVDILFDQADSLRLAFRDSFMVPPFSALYRIRIRCKGREDFMADPFDSSMRNYFEVPLDLGLIRMDLARAP